MKFPGAFASISLSTGGGDLPWAPQGFHAIEEYAPGNGDEFGLYWPFGREDEEPIVAHTYHDQGAVAPYWSSLDRFLAVAENDESPGLWAPTLDLDPDSPEALHVAAREDIAAGDVNSGIERLQSAVQTLPEFGAAHLLLSTQYRRLGRVAEAVRSAIQALTSPPCFWPPSRQMTQLAQWLSQQDTCPDDFCDDPIWKNRERLSFRFGDAKENQDYDVLKEAIETYLVSSQFVRALTLMETYHQLMRRETVSFHERYAFRSAEFRAWQDKVAVSSYGKPRVLVTPAASTDSSPPDELKTPPSPKKSRPWWKFW